MEQDVDLRGLDNVARRIFLQARERSGATRRSARRACRCSARGASRRIDDISGGRRVSRERPPRQHLVEHHAEREQIGAVIERLALDLLRRHVRHRADDGAFAGDASRVASTVGWVGAGRRRWARPKSSTFTRPSCVDHHIGRLQIAMHDLLLMRRRQRIGERQRQLEEARRAASPPAGSAHRATAPRPAPSSGTGRRPLSSVE